MSCAKSGYGQYKQHSQQSLAAIPFLEKEHDRKLGTFLFLHFHNWVPNSSAKMGILTFITGMLIMNGHPTY